MKKIYTTQKIPAVSHLKNSCSPYGFSFIKTLSLVSMAVFLSNASPVSACDLWGNVATYFGGGADIRKSIAPIYVIDGRLYRDVGSAFAGVDRKFKGLADDIKLEVKNAFDAAFIGWGKWRNQVDQQFENILSNMLVKQNAAGTITIGAQRDGSAIDIANKFHKARLITGVNAGSITATSTDAINGSQLYSLGSAVAKSFGGGADYKDGKWSAPTFMVKAFDQNGNEVDKNYNSVAAAFVGVNDSFTNLNKKIKNAFDTVFLGWGAWKKQIDKQFENILSNMLVKQNAAGTITIGAQRDGSAIDIANKFHKARLITGVNAGSITATSTDAINGSQLYSLGTAVAKSFGGGADYKDGKWSTPTFTVKVFDKDGSGADKQYQNVADAFTGVNTSFMNLDEKIENVATNVTGNSLVKQDNTGLITIGGQVSGTKISLANSNNAARTLSGVNAGSITATSTDAINGSQLYSLNNVVAGYFGGGADYKDGKWSAPTFTVKVFDKDGSGADKQYQNVSDAFTGVNTSFANLDKKIENVVANVAGDSLVKQDDTGLITIGGKVSGTRVSIANDMDAPRVLSGVNAGSITATSTDAVNGSQLYSLSNVVAGYFSHDAGYDADGKWVSPVFTVTVLGRNGSETEMHYENVADALSGVSSSFTNLNQKIKNVKDDSLVKQNSTGLITIGGSKSGNRIDIANNMGAPRVISGVKGGAFTKTSTEAVNGAQLYFMTQEFAHYFGGGAGFDKEGNWSGPTFVIKNFDQYGNETEHEYTSVAAAFAGINNTFVGLNERVKNGIGEGYEAVTNDFPFKKMLPLTRMLPIALNERADGDADTTPIAPESPSKQVSFVNSKNESRRLFGLSAGTISANSTDAINGAQLYAMSNLVATYFGGGAGYNEKGEWQAPKFMVNQFKDGSLSETPHESVASAFAGMNETLSMIDSRISKVEKNVNSPGLSNGFPWNEKEGAYDASHNGTPSKITNVADGTVAEGSKDAVNGGQLSQTNAKVTEVEKEVKAVENRVTEVENKVDVAVSYDVKDGKKTNSIKLVGGDESAPVLIENVADGKIDKGSKEAVNGGQVYDHTNEQMKIVLKDAKKYTDERVGNLINKSVNEAKSYTNMKFEALNYEMKSVRKEARQAAAIGLAVSNLRYFDDPGSLSLSFGGGLWRGQSAFAIGAGYTSEDGKIRSNLSVTSAEGQWGVGGGITLKLK
ncbi:YadA-like family protein [Bartonella sp. ML70XJBT.G]|uniref:YadA-like family protein n=1 Tax=Bartonella sp. ML70XJBT.G TaxID=3019093 RepID=UPI00235E6673|nr:YadA-like family protein [Bartonella sp. ML70XJBT.G]